LAGLFIRLKNRLIRNRLRRSGAFGVLGYALIWLASAAAGLIVGFLAWGAGRLFGADGVGVWFGVIGLAWLVLPLVSGALDETVDPRRLELLPLARRQLAVGLLAAGLVGPGALISLLAVAGAAVWAIDRPVVLVPVIVSGLGFVLWCLASSRLVTTFFSDLLRTRRGRDLAVIGASILAGLVSLGLILLTPGSDLPGAPGVDSGSGFLDIDLSRNPLRWTPPGGLGRALGLFAGGDWIGGLILLVYGVGATMVVMVLWQLVLTRLATRAPRSAAVRSVVSGQGLAPALLNNWPGPAAATSGKELRFMRRDPRFRAQAVGISIAMALLGFGAGRSLLRTEYAPFLAAVVAWMVATTGFNVFGMDDGSFWAYLVSGVDLRRVLIGKNLAFGLLGAPLLVVAALVLAFVSGHYAHLLAAILGGLAVLFVWLAVGNVTSILGAVPMPESNLFGSRNTSGAAALAAIAGIVAAGALTAPIAAAIGLPAALIGPWAGTIGAVAALGLGWLIYRLSLRVAGGLLLSRSLRMLEVLDRPSV
jgi:ABC-2 type transport system permease protein